MRLWPRKKEFWFYCFNDWVGTFGWMGLILSAGAGGGLWLAFPGQPIWMVAIATVPLFLPLLLYRQEAKVNPAEGTVEIVRGLWPFPLKHSYGRGELRWVYLSGGGSHLSSWVSIGVEDRTGRRFLLSTEGQERIEDVENEAETLARVLRAVVFARGSFHDARRRIYSGRRERLRAGVELGLAGVALGLFVILVQRGAIQLVGANGEYNAALLLLVGFASLVFLILGFPLILENAPARSFTLERLLPKRVTERWRRSV